MIVMGASLGGLKASLAVLETLPKNFGAALALVIHRQKESDETLIELIRRGSPLPALEVTDKEPILPGRVYLAPADYHLLVEPTHFCLSVDEPVRYARPSIDVLFESAADAFGSDTVAVILTGANRDGAEGAVQIKNKGGRIIVQDPRTAEAPQMPEAVLARIDPDYILPPGRIGPLLVELFTHLR